MKKAKHPAEEFTGITLEQWHAQLDNLTWAQREPRFKMMVSVVLNESRVAHEMSGGCSEARAFGRVEGYHYALAVLRSLGTRPPREQPSVEADYREHPEHVFKDKEPLD